jgi:predicted DNA-binding protein
MKTITCRLPEHLNARLNAVAREQSVSKSQVIRKALEQNFSKHWEKRALRAIDLVRDLSGSVNGPADILTNPKYMEDFGV